MNLNWLVLMAWRDSRRNFSRLLLFISSVILGIAALVSIFALSDTLSREIDEQAGALLGADLEISSTKKLSDSLLQRVNKLPGKYSEQRSFASMVFFPKNGSSRLIQVRALSGEYPYYGTLETTPIAAANAFRKKRSALVDKSLLLQFDIEIGDSVRVGEKSFVIEGRLEAAPGQTGMAASVAPIVYIPLDQLDQTGLEQKGSRITRSFFFKLPDPSKAGLLSVELEPFLKKEAADIDTIEARKEQSARSFRDLTRFLSLIGFIALLLGCIGVASAIHIYVREKIGSIAVLRCLGASAKQAFLIYLIQIVVIGLAGSLIGILIGNLIQTGLPVLISDLLPIEVRSRFSWTAALKGLGLGLGISILFALLPLITIRDISPLHTLRVAVQTKRKTDPLHLLIGLLIVLFVLSFTRFQLRNWREAFFFTGGLLLCFGALTGIARILMWLSRHYFPTGWSYLWRQGSSNLYRPNNQTTILLVSIGLGTALLSLLIITQSLLLNRVTVASSGNQPNMVLFDIQSAQREDVIRTVKSHGLTTDGTVPIVTMRLQQINGITGETLERDSTLPIKPWVFSREYRVTFRDSLIESERITKGSWVGNSTGTNIPVSVEEGFARRNTILIGDTLLFNVQGTMLSTIVASYRKVDWNRIQTNFLVVFPSGVLEAAPQFHVLVTRTPSPEAGAQLQRELVTRFPNVSVIDLTLILSVIDTILSKIGFVIRFMSGFCLITGLIVLIASVLISKYQRIQESVLLRTLGANRRQIYWINMIEYGFIGALASLTGIILSLLAGWALATFSFDVPFEPDWFMLLSIMIGVILLTIVIGLFNIRTIVSRSPLEILRQE